MSETKKTVREVAFDPRGLKTASIPSFRATENGREVSYFSDLNSENREDQRDEVIKALKWAGIDVLKKDDAKSAKALALMNDQLAKVADARAKAKRAA